MLGYAIATGRVPRRAAELRPWANQVNRFLSKICRPNAPLPPAVTQTFIQALHDVCERASTSQAFAHPQAPDVAIVEPPQTSQVRGQFVTYTTVYNYKYLH